MSNSEKCFCHFGEFQVKDATSRIEIDKNKIDINENNFTSQIALLERAKDFDVVGIEYFKNGNSIDETLENGQNVITNYLNVNKRCIEIPAEFVKTLVFKKMDISVRAENVWVKLDKEGTGEIEIYFSSDNGTTYTEINDDEITEWINNDGTEIRIKLILTGNIILKNLAWGVNL